MPTLKITRSSEYANRLRNIKLFLDGKELGKIANGETRGFEISAGAHTLQAKVDWCSSNKLAFTIAEKQSKVIELTSFAKHNALGTFATIYYITFGASNFFNLKEQK